MMIESFTLLGSSYPDPLKLESNHEGIRAELVGNLVITGSTGSGSSGWSLVLIDVGSSGTASYPGLGRGES